MKQKSLLTPLMFVAVLIGAPISQADAQNAPSSCAGDPACISSCGRFDNTDARLAACKKVCERRAALKVPASIECTKSEDKGPTQGAEPEVRDYSKKGDTVRERELNGKMLEAITRRDLREIRRLIEMNRGLNPTYVYDFNYNAQTRLYEGRAVKLRLADIFNDTITIRGDDPGLDKVLALLIELGLDVTATLPKTLSSEAQSSLAESKLQLTAWGPSLKFMERAKDRASRMRAFDLALEKGLKPNDDVGEWLFAELPQVCGRDRSQFAIEVVDLLVRHLGTSLQDDLWRMGERGPETLSDVLDRLMSPGTIPRSNSERAQFAMMDEVWENCALLSRRIHRYLTEGT